jgi:hypothetical protein
MDVSNDFEFNFGTNPDILEELNLEQGADTSANIQKLYTSFKVDPWAARNEKSRRKLQSSGSDPLTS